MDEVDAVSLDVNVHLDVDEGEGIFVKSLTALCGSKGWITFLIILCLILILLMGGIMKQWYFG